ncbi:MAG: DUF2155 domain-containing protein [Candidatus Rickettsia vulgarisii]
MPKLLTKYLIFIFFCLFTINVHAEDAFNDINSFDTTDEMSDDEIMKEVDSLNIENPYNKLAQILNSNIENLELKSCSSGKITALNKITATSKELLLKTNEPQYFGNIQIKLHKCFKNLDPYNEDNYMLLTVIEHKIDEDSKLIFQGWMSSSSISLSTFEHPIYEIFANNCL